MKTVSYIVRVEVLTPVHVGSGDSLNALNYIQQGDTLYVLDPDRWMEWLGGRQGAYRYIGWVEDSLGRGAGLNQFLQERLRLNPSEVATVAKQVSRYAVRLEECGNPDPLRGFRTHIRDARDRAYLPGSSLKGAIRTALIEDLLLGEDALQERLMAPLKRIRGGGDNRQLRREVRQVWQGMEADTLRGGRTDAHYDLLRFVQVSDSEPLAHEQVSVRKVRSEGTSRNTNTWLEALREGAQTRVRLSFQPEAPLQLLRLREELGQYLHAQELFAALADRAERRLERELAYPYPAAVKQKVQALLAQNSEATPLLCIGWGQGYLGTTVMGLVLDESPDEYAQAVRNLLPVLSRRGQGIDARRFPKTRRAVRDARDTARSPLGWVRLVLEESPAAH